MCGMRMADRWRGMPPRTEAERQVCSQVRRALSKGAATAGRAPACRDEHTERRPETSRRCAVAALLLGAESVQPRLRRTVSAVCTFLDEYVGSGRVQNGRTIL